MRTQLAYLAACLMTAVALGGPGLAVHAESADANGPDGSRKEVKDQVLPQQAHPVTPVAGPSWIGHLGLSVSQTQMGQMGGSAPPSETSRREPDLRQEEGALHRAIQEVLSLFRSNPERAAEAFQEPFVLTGADLYRLNCQSCHGPEGEGAPPEIKSLLGPVQGASAAAIKARMAERGVSIDDSVASHLASQAEGALRDRVANGGKQMPSFPHLRGDELDALLAYLKSLAEVPGASGDGPLVTQSAARVGEHVVKGTCHICHDATGPGGGHMAMMRGTIPSLASFPREASLSAVQRQVEYGSSGGMMMMRAQRMPALPYLTEDEVAAAYLYLADYPPQP